MTKKRFNPRYWFYNEYYFLLGNELAKEINEMEFEEYKVYDYHKKFRSKRKVKIGKSKYFIFTAYKSYIEYLGTNTHPQGHLDFSQQDHGYFYI